MAIAGDRNVELLGSYVNSHLALYSRTRDRYQPTTETGFFRESTSKND